MKELIEIKSYIGIIIMLFFASASLFDIMGYNANTLDYERVYHIGNEGVKWKFQSGQNFITWNIGAVIIALLYITANLFFLFKFKENKILKFILLGVEIIFLIWFFWSYYEWYLTGFDH